MDSSLCNIHLPIFLKANFEFDKPWIMLMVGTGRKNIIGNARHFEIETDAKTLDA